jgi:beta-galactosidase/beta-glucuronidase
MNKDIYIYSKTSENLLFISGINKDEKYTISNSDKTILTLPVIEYQEEKKTLDLKADSLSKWTPDTPVLYTLTLENNSTITFGFTEVTSFNNSAILLNGDQIYLRGYIRGIVAHDHPNLTGLSEYEAYKKHISKEKKYGFKLFIFV